MPKEKKFADNVVYNYENETFDANIKPYGTDLSAPAIRPNDMSTIKGRAVTAAEKYAEKEIEKLKKQAELIMEQANEVKERVEISKLIYDAEFGFEPVIGEHYYLYKRENESHFLSLVPPEYWGRVSPGTFISKVELLPDRTWEVIEDGV